MIAQYTASLLLRIDPALVQRIDSFAARERVRRKGQRLTRSDVVRQMITTALDGLEKAERDQKASA